ncbi:MAG: type III PLP-dependent enzyme [Gammaproteobacteria bacterium]|nr:type III PLP-dependent enzyme [Gammaproteobacteria bacterium]
MFPNFDSIESLVRECRPHEPVYCLRPSVIEAETRRFIEVVPARVLYAVKSNPHPAVLDILHAAGVGDFDTASPGEMRLVKDRFPGAKCYFMHPVKSRRAIADALREFGIRHLVVDHGEELSKLCEVTERRDLVVLVRLATRGTDARFNLSRKFGASPDDAAALLRAAHRHGFDTGLCFHVGSQCLSPAAFDNAFDDVRRVLESARSPISTLDVGGGFPARYEDARPPPLESFAAAIRRGAESLDAGIELFCEPGRALVAEGMSVLTRVELRKDNRIYLNDGIYGSLHGMSIGLRFPLRLVRADAEPGPHDTEFVAFGPTCDGLDELPQRFRLPSDVEEGDWIEVGCMGAYTVSLRTTFNGFYPDRFATVEEPFLRIGDTTPAFVDGNIA